MMRTHSTVVVVLIFVVCSSPALGQAPAAKAKTPLNVCLVSGSLEYKSDESLAEFQKYLEANCNVKCSRAFRKTDDDLPGLENLEHCDVMLLFTRRLTISGEQLERVKKYCDAGKPIVAVRTASHAFQNWLALDKEVLGGNYQGHYDAGSASDISVTAKGKDHPILKGVTLTKGAGGLYKNPGLAQDSEVLLTGAILDHTEPIAWIRLHKGGRLFYTSLGHPKDFEDENFRRLLANALFWTAEREVERK
jgi:type 1 glutamine amidotransferase